MTLTFEVDLDKKTHCIPIGRRSSVGFTKGRAISWVSEVRYLGILLSVRDVSNALLIMPNARFILFI